MILVHGDETKKEVLQLDNNHYSIPAANVEEVEDDVVIQSKVDDDVPAVEPVVIGTVVDCAKLNVRRAPSMKATVVCTIPSDAEVTIDEGKSTAEWYSVCTAAGVNGFCMKKYIAISQ